MPAVAADREVTWHADVRPLVEGRCMRCHSPGNIGPFSLTSYDEAFAHRREVRAAVLAREMPPWLPADCCNEFRQDFSLDAEQIALIDAWVERGAPEGDPADYPGPLPAIGGLSRVDVTASMAEPYLPEPEPGRVDDFRCFLLDWPLDEPVFITGINPVPGARSIVHHLVIGYVAGDDLDSYDGVPGSDGRPGFPCEGGLGDHPVTGILGGSVSGGDFPPGFGERVPPGSKILLNVHYSLASSPPVPDQTQIEIEVEPESAGLARLHTIPLANPAWLVSDAMRIPAGEKDVRYRFQFEPDLYTRDREVLLWGYTPHMHEFGSAHFVGIVRAGGDTECLTSIPRWEFGWEQPYWFARPIRLGPDDQLYLECDYDNSLENQPIVDGKRLEPRDIAWGTDNQDMCAGFLSWSEVE